MRTIVIDTREQRPWAFPEWVPTKIGTLRTGDYALEGDEHFAIERKSLDDFLGTVFSHWRRFLAEIERMNESGFPCKVVLVEGDFRQFCFYELADDIMPPEHSHERISPAAVMSKVAELSFMGVSVLFCQNAEFAAGLAYQLLLQRNIQLEKESWSRQS